MKKMFALLTVLCLVCSVAALAETGEFTFRNGVAFGMTQDEVLNAEGNAPHKMDVEHAGGIVLDDMEFEDISDNGFEADLHYYFLEGKLIAAVLEYDDDASYDQILNDLTNRYGASAALDPAEMGNIMSMLDDDGHLGQAQAWKVGQVLIVLGQDGDDVKAGYVDMSAAFR